jgi:hypothetical protein
VLLASILLALPLAVVMRGALEAHLGQSLQADAAAAGWNEGWANEFAAQAQGLGRAFTHEFLGFGGTVAIMSRLADGVPLDPALAAAAAASIALWVFLSGGLLDRLARGRPVRTAHFFGACAVYAVRFLRLAVVVGAAYWAIFRWLHPFLFGTIYHAFTSEMTQERDGIILRTILYAVLALALALVNVTADFAKVRAVVEDRRSMLGALGAAMRFIRRRWLKVTGLYLLNAVAFLAILRIWLQIAPSAAAPGWVALLAAEIYLLARVWAKLAFMASEIVYFQGELAHAGYTAAPPLRWPESAAAEAVSNLTAGPTP